MITLSRAPEDQGDRDVLRVTSYRAVGTCEKCGWSIICRWPMYGSANGEDQAHQGQHAREFLFQVLTHTCGAQ